jgi:hypothetical protein
LCRLPPSEIERPRRQEEADERQRRDCVAGNDEAQADPRERSSSRSAAMRSRVRDPSEVADGIHRFSKATSSMAALANADARL